MHAHDDGGNFWREIKSSVSWFLWLVGKKVPFQVVFNMYKMRHV